MRSCYALCAKSRTLRVLTESTVWTYIGCSSTRLDVVEVNETSVKHKEAISLELRTEANINTAFQRNE